MPNPATQSSPRKQGEAYLLNLPNDTMVPDLKYRRLERTRAGRGARPQVPLPLPRIDAWAARRPESFGPDR